MTPWLIFSRDVTLAFRRGGGALAASGFCLVAFVAFAFALGPEALEHYGVCVLVISVFLACLLALPGVFERDQEDGTLEQCILSPAPLEILMASKIAAFWLTAAVPLIILAPLLALMAGMTTAATEHMLYILLLTTPALAAIGAFGASLTLGVRASGFTHVLVVLPLYFPPLIFATSGGEGAILILAAISCAVFPLACLLCAALVRE